MSTQIQRRRGTTAEHSTFTGALAETTIDTDKDTVVVHDGTTVGGHPLMRENGSNSALALGSAGTPSLKFTGDTNTGLYSPGADQVAISTNGTGRLTIDGSGNVNVDSGTVYVDAANNRLGVGTTSPGGQLDVSGTSDTRVITRESGNSVRTDLMSQTTQGGVGTTSNHPFFIQTNGSERCRVDTSGRLLVGTSSSSDSNCLAAFQGNPASASNGAQVHFRRGEAATAITSGEGIGYLVFTDNADKQFAYIGCEADATAGTNDYPGRLVFSVTRDGQASPTEALRIGNNGTVDIATTSSGYGLRLANSSGADRALILAGISGVTNGLTVDFVNSTSAMAYKFNSLVTTASAANAFLDSADENRLYRSTSSLRYKTDIEDIEQNRADAVLGLRPVWYRSKAADDRKDWSWYGLIAEEVAKVEPRLVHWTYLDDAYDVETVNGVIKKTLKEGAKMVPDGVQYDRLAVLLIDVVKRQQQAIETLEAKVAALESA